jgi:hypothetical protein
MKYEFNAVESLSLENSFGTIKAENNIELSITIGIDETDGTGWFELYDTETGGDEWYGEGGLWFDGKELTDYDGVFALPVCVINKLKELGYDTTYAE